MPTERVRTLVAEDEAHARATLREYLAGADFIEVVAEASDGREALEIANRERPALLFLDVRMPELSGIEVARQLAYDADLVFTTAYDKFAIAAFEIGALDYLVKPFGRARLQETLRRLRQRSRTLLPDVERARSLSDAPLRQLFARQADRIIPIPLRRVTRIKANGDYAEVFTPEGSHLMHVSLAELAERLPPQFRQVHRSHIVNLDFVEYCQKFDERRLMLRLNDGTEVVASRAASELLRGWAR